MHETKPEDGSLFNFTDYAEKMAQEQEAESTLSQQDEDEIIASLDDLKQEIDYANDVLNSEIDDLLG